ncbi:MAG: transferrin-binding protein-like solute binding protein [Ruegeria sp.]
MTTNFGFCAIALVAGFSLSACSSSSSGSSDGGSNATSEITLPQNGTLELDGQAITAEVAGTTVSNIATRQTSTLRMTTEDGDIVAASFRAPASGVSLDSRSGDSLVRSSSGVLLAFDSADLNDGAVLIDPSQTRFEHQTFGVWLEDRNRPVAVVGAGSYGYRTDSSDVPTGRNATYEGVSTGIALLADGNGYLTASEIEVTTNFRNATIRSSDTIASRLSDGTVVNAPELDFSGSGNVSGNTFRANIAGTGTSGTADGIFYGRNAEEVGGTFQATGAGGVSHVGAFGAD